MYSPLRTLLRIRIRMLLRVVKPAFTPESRHRLFIGLTLILTRAERSCCSTLDDLTVRLGLCLFSLTVYHRRDPRLRCVCSLDEIRLSRGILLASLDG